MGSNAVGNALACVMGLPPDARPLGEVAKEYNSLTVPIRVGHRLCCIGMAHLGPQGTLRPQGLQCMQLADGTVEPASGTVFAAAGSWEALGMAPCDHRADSLAWHPVTTGQTLAWHTWDHRLAVHAVGRRNCGARIGYSVRECWWQGATVP